MKIKLSAQHATRIAQLFNSIKVADHMLAHPEDRTVPLADYYRRWNARKQECVDTLYRDYGITVVGTTPS